MSNVNARFLLSAWINISMLSVHVFIKASYVAWREPMQVTIDGKRLGQQLLRACWISRININRFLRCFEAESRIEVEPSKHGSVHSDLKLDQLILKIDWLFISHSII